MMTNKMQIFDLFIYTQSALCFSGDVFVHHREHLTVFTCFWYSPPMLLPGGVMDEMEREFHLVHETGRQQHRWTISEAVNAVKCS